MGLTFSHPIFRYFLVHCGCLRDIRRLVVLATSTSYIHYHTYYIELLFQDGFQMGFLKRHPNQILYLTNQSIMLWGGNHTELEVPAEEEFVFSVDCEWEYLGQCPEDAIEIVKENQPAQGETQSLLPGTVMLKTSELWMESPLCICNSLLVYWRRRHGGTTTTTCLSWSAETEAETMWKGRWKP